MRHASVYPRRSQYLPLLTSAAIALGAGGCKTTGAQNNTNIILRPDDTQAQTNPLAQPGSDRWSPEMQQVCAASAQLTAGRVQSGDNRGGQDRFHATCGFGALGADKVYSLTLDRPSLVRARLRGTFDTVLSIRAGCGDDTTEVACNDDAERDGTNSALSVELPAGTYSIIADGFTADGRGTFTLAVEVAPLAGAATLPVSIERPAEGDGVTVATSNTAGVTGTATFAKRSFTPRGLTRAVQWLPAARAHVVARDNHEQIVAQTDTDEHGAFRLPLAAGANVRVQLESRTTYLGSDLRVVSDPGTERPYVLSTHPMLLQPGATVTFRADVGRSEPAGAFNILANFVKYLPHVQGAFDGRMLPPLYAFWRRGNNQALPQGSITAFLGEYPRHAGTYALQIQGGDAGQEDLSDADQFDDPVVLHEFSHFVVRTLAGQFSLGGNHPGRALYFPGLAMDEGFASALACAVAGNSRYWDTAGLEPEEPLAQARGRVLLDEDSERLTADLRGIGSQDVSQAMLWDMMDGAEGLPDADNDGVAIGLTNALRIYHSFQEGDAPPAMNSFLERGVTLNLLTDAQARSLVRSPEHLGFGYPIQPGERWPEDLQLGVERRGRIDGRTNPAPSGGHNNAYNGFDAARLYRFRLMQRQRVQIDLTIDGAGTAATHTDVDMTLMARNLHRLASSDGTSNTEHISQELDAGMYLIHVHDGDMGSPGRRDGGNRATYTLRVR